MKRVIVHVGMPKCGSSFLQNSLNENRHLLASAGIGLPQTGYSDKFLKLGARHLRYSRALELEGPHGPMATALRSEIDASPLDTFIITQEGMAEDNEPDTVRAALEGYDVTVVIYCRNPLDFIESKYRQWVVFGSYHSIARYLDQQIKSVDLRDTIERWRRTFGKEGVRVRSVDHLVDREGLAADMFAAVGIDAPALVPSSIRNERVSNAMVLLHLVSTLRKRMSLPSGPLAPGFDYGSNEGRLLTDSECEELDRTYGTRHLALLRAEGIADSFESRDRRKPWDADFFNPTVREQASNWIAAAAAAKDERQAAAEIKANQVWWRPATLRRRVGKVVRAMTGRGGRKTSKA